MPQYISLISCMLISAFLVFYSIPTIIGISRLKKLYDVPNERKVNTHVVPTLGGVAIFLGFVLSTTVFSYHSNFNGFRYILASLIIMLFVGLKDDLLDLSPRKKLTAECIAALIICTLGNIHFTDLHGLFGIHGINHFISIPFTVLFIAFIINAINLIDGIDGLASGITILICGTLGWCFFASGQYDYAIMSVALIGSLAAFFVYNVFGNSNKIFMGDTGSLILGLIVSVLIIQFNEINITSSNAYPVLATPAVSLGILVVPVIDTLRVMILRMAKGGSPFRADRNHVHHKLLDLKFSHLQSTLIIMGVNVAFIAFSFTFQRVGIHALLAAIILAGFALAFTPALILRSKNAALNATTDAEQITESDASSVKEQVRFKTKEQLSPAELAELKNLLKETTGLSHKEKGKDKKGEEVLIN